MWPAALRTITKPPATAGVELPLKYDVNLRQPGQRRDAKCIVMGSDGSAYHTCEHDQTFIKLHDLPTELPQPRRNAE